MALFKSGNFRGRAAQGMRRGEAGGAGASADAGANAGAAGGRAARGDSSVLGGQAATGSRGATGGQAATGSQGAAGVQAAGGGSGAEESPEAPAVQRLAYFDNLRSFVIFLVIVLHSSIIYSGIGNWYYSEVGRVVPGSLESIVFGAIASFTQAWFMGLMFFISAYWAAKSLAKRGAARFLKSRAQRLAAPLVAYVLFVAPLIKYVIVAGGNARTLGGVCAAYAGYIAKFEWVNMSGPLWFAEALLIFSAAYAAFRARFPKREGHREDWLGAGRLAIIVAATTIASFLVRVWLPIGTEIHNLSIAYFPTYIVLFALGAMTGERNSLGYVSSAKNIKLCPIVFAVGAPLWLMIMDKSGAGYGVDYHLGGW
ncbi:MAG: acyltransferase family protein, partial [Clostridiales bacterium]|nr:acyltransferase family protein [Clostridiales bacterium]